MDLNKVMIIGRLTRDPELKNTPSGQSVVSFSVATGFTWVDQSGQKQEKTEFHNVVAWRKLAEVIGQYLKKGSKVYLEGKLQTREWAGQDGVKRYRTEVIAENMIMLDSKGSAGGGSFEPRTPGRSTSNADDSMQDGGYDDEIKVENIPF